MLHLYEKNNANAPRLRTDSLFVDFGTRYDLKGKTDEMPRLVESVQLKDVALWRRLIQLFRGNPDDCDRGWRGEYFGKLMRSGCFVWAYTRDEELYRVLTDAVEDMLTTQDDLGRFSTYSVEKEFDGWDLWGRKYVMLGFQYYMEICRDTALRERLVTAMVAHADYILEHIGEGEGKKNILEASRHFQGLNSSTILEPIVRLYTITGYDRYLQFARYIVENGGIARGNLIELALENTKLPSEYPVTKAYEMMSFFEGVLEYYRVTGEEKYRRAVENFAKAVAENELSIIGCAGCSHEFFDNSDKTQTDATRMMVMQETCVTVTWMKLCFQLLCLTGASKYADLIECSAYNALYGAVNTMRSTKNNGFPFDSYSPLLPNKRARASSGVKPVGDGYVYGCCVSIGGCGLGLVPKATCLTRKDGIALSLYADGEITTNLPNGNEVKLVISGGYPVNGEITIAVEGTEAEAFVLALRIPRWSEQVGLEVNGEPISAVPGTYAEISRVWKPGDKVLLKLDMRIKPRNQDALVSFTRGPLVLARDARFGEDIFDWADVTLNEDGSVQVEETHTATFPVQIERRLVQSGGYPVTLVDYASAGKTWDYDSMTTVWVSTTIPVF